MTFSLHEIEWTPEKSARLWDYYSSSPAHWSQYFGAIAGPAVATFLGRHFDLSAKSTIVDVSCGRGDLVAALRAVLPAGPRLGKRLVGLEFSEQSLVVCRARFGLTMPDVEFDATSAVLAAGTLKADLLLATEVVEHLDDGELKRFFADLARLAQPGATLFISTPNSEDYSASKVCCPDCGCVFHRWQHRRVWTAASLALYAESQGWTTTVCEAVDWGAFQPDRRPWLRRVASRVLARFSSPGPRTGLAYLGTFRKPG